MNPDKFLFENNSLLSSYLDPRQKKQVEGRLVDAIKEPENLQTTPKIERGLLYQIEMKEKLMNKMKEPGSRTSHMSSYPNYPTEKPFTNEQKKSSTNYKLEKTHGYSHPTDMKQTMTNPGMRPPMIPPYPPYPMNSYQQPPPFMPFPPYMPPGYPLQSSYGQPPYFMYPYPPYAPMPPGSPQAVPVNPKK